MTVFSFFLLAYVSYLELPEEWKGRIDISKINNKEISTVEFLLDFIGVKTSMAWKICEWIAGLSKSHGDPSWIRTAVLLVMKSLSTQMTIEDLLGYRVTRAQPKISFPIFSALQHMRAASYFPLHLL